MSTLPKYGPAAAVAVGIVVAILVNFATDGLEVGRWRWVIIGTLFMAALILIIIESSLSRSSSGRNRSKNRRGGNSRMWQLPPIDPPVERAGLAESLERLLVSDSTPVVGLTTGVYGAGGFGKTTLAASVCDRDEVRDRFPGGLLWVTIGMDKKSADLAAIINDLSAQLTDDRPQFSDPEQAGRHLGQLLDERPPMLLVIDDVWSGEQSRPFLHGGRRTTRLITTRNPATLPASAQLVHVDEMATHESRELLQRELPPLPPELAGRLLGHTGNWPLLLAIVNGVIQQYARDGVSVSEAAEVVDAHLADQGPSFFDVRVEERREHAVRLTVAASMRLLQPIERDRYLQLGIFGEDTEIPLAMLSLFWGVSATETRQLCETLASLSLVKSYRRGSAAMQLHDVIRAHLRHELRERLPEVNRRFLAASRAVLPDPKDDWWQLPRSAGYLWNHLPYHLSEAGEEEALRSLVCDLRWGEQKIQMLGLPAFEADLSRCAHPAAAALRQAIVRKGHLLGPIEPVYSHADLLVSRLGEVPGLHDLVREYRMVLPRNVPRLINSWPIPPVDPALLRVVALGNAGLTGCAFARDGARLAVSTEDGVVRLLSARSWSEQSRLREHAGAATAVAYSPDGTWLVTMGADGMCRVIATETSRETAELTGHEGAVHGCAFSPDGGTLVTAGADGRAQVYSTGTWTLIRTLRCRQRKLTGCAFAPDGRSLVLSGADGLVRWYDTARWTETGDLTGLTAVVHGCVFSEAGEWLAVLGGDGVTQIWRTRDRTLWTKLSGHVGAVRSAAFAPGDRIFVTTGADQTVRLWDTTNWALTALIRGHTEAVTGCSFAPDGKHLVTVSSDHNLRVWDTGNDYERGSAYRQNRSVTSCSVEPAGNWMVTTGIDGAASVWEIADPVERKVLHGHAKPLTASAIAVDGSWLATASEDHTVAIWRAGDLTKVATLRSHVGPVTDCAVSSDGQWLATVGADGKAFLWETETWQQAAVLASRNEPLTSCCFAADGISVVLTTAEGAGYVFEGRERNAPTHVLNGHAEAVTDCAFSPDGVLLATASIDHTVAIWRTGSWHRAATLREHRDVVTACSFSPNGAWLATVGGDNVIRIWEVTTWSVGAAMRTNGRPNDVCWLSDSKGVFVGCVGGIYQFAFAAPMR
jgi:WD40 repeat protein